MKFIEKPIIAFSLVVLLGACVSQTPAPEPVVETKAVVKAQPAYFLNSSEYKLLLNPEMFEDYKAGFEAYWNIINEVALAEGIPVIASEHPMKLKHKEVSFFDTPDLDLRKNGYLLRQKQKYKKGEKTSGYEYGVKFRRTVPAEALSVDLSLAEGYTPKYGEIELESDIVYNSVANGATHTTYSISNSIKIDDQPELNINTFTKIYPALKSLGITKGTALVKVAGISADEWMVVPGKLDFGDGLYGRMDMTIWILETEAGQVLIPEFSFDHPFFEDRHFDKQAMLRCTSFIDKLQSAYPEWVVPGTLKAAALFDMAQ